MFRNVPECSGMFHVPGFIDAPTKYSGVQSDVQLISTSVVNKP